jgi:P27 family predicted phage terminase small subunit
LAYLWIKYGSMRSRTNKPGAGRPRTPDKIKKAMGTFRKDRALNGIEPDPIGEVPEPPDYLDEYGQAEWRSKASHLVAMGLISEADLGALAALCNEFQNYLAAEAACRKNARYYAVLGDDKKVKYWGVHPAHTTAQQHLKAYQSLCNEFGMTPASRVKLPDGQVDKRKKTASILDFVKGGSTLRAKTG